jgi:2-dehydropantoate 2-reductase
MPGAPAKARRACLDLLADRRRNTGKTHTGFWRDLAVRKRPTEVEPLLGTVVALGREAGVPTPALRVLVRLVHDIECGQRKLSRDTFDILLEYCHALDR